MRAGRVISIGMPRWIPFGRIVAIGSVLVVVPAACSPAQYVQTADRDAYAILDSHRAVDRTSAPADLSVIPSANSRLFDPTPVEAPLLPDPTPRLHTYSIPPGIGEQPNMYENFQSASPSSSDAPRATPRVRRNGAPARADLAHHPVERHIILAALQEQPDPNGADDELVISPIPIPPSAWESIPAECRTRMFEFQSLRDVYARSFGAPPAASQRDPAPRLNFDDILYLALLNSREYQSQKEQLYRVALRLSLEQYDYQLKFSPFGNRTGVRYEHRDSSVNSQERLDVPSSVQAESLLSTGTGFVARFANTVLLTFNGPDGFAADIGSELLFDFTHSVFQNDVRFERLTQVERNVVYAARNFERFRRTFYLQLAIQYYNLLRTYRQVEIDAQNYLSLVRVYSQRAVELDQGEVARVQIDQVEQNALAGRSSLIGTANNLENALDQLKTRMGLPTETPINLDLAELDFLTLGDEVLVNLELLRRVEARLTAELGRENADEVGVLNLAAELVARILESLQLQRRLHSRPNAPETDESVDQSDAPPRNTQGQRTQDTAESLRRLQAWLGAAEFRIRAQRIRARLESARSNPNDPVIRVPEIAGEFARLVLALLTQELNLARELDMSPRQIAGIERAQADLADRLQTFTALLDQIISQVQLERLDELNGMAESLSDAAAASSGDARALTVARARELGLSFDESTQRTVSRLREQADRLLVEAQDSLPPIDLNMDAASMAALAGRLDLANARGALFDEWRGTKLAADDLGSILDLRARQRLITQNQESRAFDFDFDESRTELSIAVDTPLNRRAQRNAFREQLLNYQSARRSVMALEDAIKRDIREGLRSIQLSREQHALGIASAALAYERVISTELQLRLGVPGVVARDYLEAQNAYASSLSAVAGRRIGYIISRINLFSDLDQLAIDADGYWAGLHDPSATPAVDVDQPPAPTYGDLPRDLRYSRELRERTQQFWRVEDTANEQQESHDCVDCHSDEMNERRVEPAEADVRQPQIHKTPQK